MLSYRDFKMFALPNYDDDDDDESLLLPITHLHVIDDAI